METSSKQIVPKKENIQKQIFTEAWKVRIIIRLDKQTTISQTYYMTLIFLYKTKAAGISTYARIAEQSLQSYRVDGKFKIYFLMLQSDKDPC